MRKLDKLGIEMPRNWETALRMRNYPRAAIAFTKFINGTAIAFSVTYQDRTGRFPAKIIDVTDSIGCGPAISYAAALSFAKEMIGSEWNAAQRKRMG
jgi:hypothetical protein